MPALVMDSLTVALLATGMIAFSLGAFGGVLIARSRLSDVELCKMQLRRVRQAPFKKQKLMNFSEYSVFRTIEQDMMLKRSGFRIVAQAPLGEILKSDHEKGFRSVNGKRVDMLIVDRGGWPILAIEYQGEGHHSDTSGLRDAIKRTALTKAGIGYLEIFPKDKNDAPRLLSLVHEALGWNSQDQSTGVRGLQDRVHAVHS